MKVLGISGDEQKAFWLILAAIYHLGAAGATKGEIVNPQSFFIRSTKYQISENKDFPRFLLYMVCMSKRKGFRTEIFKNI